jgi:D-xylose transport system ATP-binding protein
MKNGRVVGTVMTKDISHDDVLGMIIAGKCPPTAIPGPGALRGQAA